MARLFFILVVAACVGSCLKTNGSSATAYRVTQRSQLVGGQRALGEVGDYKLTNGVIHAIIQDVGTSRGFGAFGGSLIDIDLVRASSPSGSAVPKGFDGFTEMFPAFFLQAVEPSKVEVLSDGTGGTAAVIRVSGGSGNFLSILNGLNDVVIPKVPLSYTVDYTLEPGKSYLKIVVTMNNLDANSPALFPIQVPFGFVSLLGEGQDLFVPGQAGFDIRFRLDEVYKRPSSLDALPGEVAPYIATQGEGVSYALAASTQNAAYMQANAGFYPGATRDSLLLPLAASSFLGTYWARAPNEIGPKKSFTYAGYLAVGSGDVASAAKVIYDIDDDRERRPTAYGWLAGSVREKKTLQNWAHGSVVIQDADTGDFVSQVNTDGDGRFRAPVPPGRNYVAWANDGVRTPAVSGRTVRVESAGATAEIDVEVDAPASLEVTVFDERGRPLPAKVSVEGRHDYAGNVPARTFLYKLAVGDRMRSTDLDPDNAADPETRRYLERVFYAGDGKGGKAIRPGAYKVWVSRGPEYSLESRDVTLESGKTTRLSVTLKHVVTSPGWVSADFHVHSVNSVDSAMGYVDRVESSAAEGVDVLTSTDHNFVTDFAPTVEALGLSDWLKTVVGLELTTLEMGHFNAFPVKLDKGAITHGSFNWFFRPPGELLAQLRGLSPDGLSTLIQVNHPRDTILGYFNAFNLTSYTHQPYVPTTLVALDTKPLPDGGTSPYVAENFSLDFDVLEVFNGKRRMLLESYRIPLNPIEGEPPKLEACPTVGPQTKECIPAPGEVLQTVVKVPVPGQPGVTVDQVQPSFPGAFDDWYTLLGKGHRFTATGNSDSHSGGAEAGLPRTYVWVGATADGSLRGLSEASIIEGVRAGRATCTNGPFVEMWVNDVPIGGEVVAADGKVKVRIKVQAAPWVDVRRVVVKRGGRDQGQRPFVLETLAVPESQDVTRLDVTREYSGLPDGAFMVVEVSGDKSMWPVFTPYEIPPLQINDVVGNIGEAFGLADKYGKYRPSPVQQVTPFAFTNPIFIRHAAQSALKVKKRELPLDKGLPFRPREMRDLRKLYEAFHSDLD